MSKWLRIGVDSEQVSRNELLYAWYWFPRGHGIFDNEPKVKWASPLVENVSCATHVMVGRSSEVKPEPPMAGGAVDYGPEPVTRKLTASHYERLAVNLRQMVNGGDS